MKSSEYWSKRFDQIEQASNNKSVKFTKQLDKKYKTAANEIDTKINAWYQRLADNNGVSITEAKKLLTNSELKEFKWTVQEYIKAGEENALDQRWMKELENASAKFHISRLEALKLECKQQVEMAMGTGQYDMFDTLANVYKDTYYHSCFEVQKGVGVGFDVAKLSDKQVQTVLNKPWSVDGTNFSTKVWNNKTKLINNLDQELSRMVMTGESPRQAIQNIRKSMDTSLYNAKRLVMTESAYFTTVGQQDAFEELDVEEYEIVATLDNRTSDICQKQDGKHYPVKDMMPGVNAPPFHVFCRSTTCPYFNDEFTVDDKRVAKNEETGEWYEVPANMTYPEWKNSFVDGGDKSELTPIEPEEKITLKDKIQTVKDDIVANGGVITENHIKNAGKYVKEELVEIRKPLKEKVELTEKEYKSFGYDELVQERKQYSFVNRGLKEPSEIGLSSKEEAMDKYNDADRRLTELYKNPDFIKAGNEMRIAKNDYKGTTTSNAKELKDKLSEIREVGSDNLDVKSHLNNSRSPMRKIIEEAYNHYPTEWIKKSIQEGNLTVKKVQRGYYGHYDKTIAISGYDDADCLATSFHELGHRFEKIIEHLTDVEKEFYGRRTEGEKLQWLGYGYSKSEKTKVDNFLSEYMGKDYGGKSFELVSMGFEYAYTDPTKLWDDEDMAQWIYGILALL